MAHVKLCRNFIDALATIVYVKKDGHTNGSGVPSNVFFVVISKARFLKWCKCGVNQRVLATSRHIF